MLPKALRLPSSEIPNIARYGTSVFNGNEYYIKKSLPSADFTESLWAISIGTKVDKRAAVRNRIKRIFRNAILEKQQSGELRPGKYLVVVKSPQITSVTL